MQQIKHRPKDMTSQVLPDERIPPWFKRNYSEWIRYAYDIEERE